jgi:hypothetical protein
MPWKVTDVVDERTRFVLEYDSGSFTMAELGVDEAIQAAEICFVRRATAKGHGFSRAIQESNYEGFSP